MWKINEFDITLSQWWWLLGIWEKESDYKFGSSDMALELISQNTPEFNRQIKYTYNQRAQEITRNSCTLYSAITELSWLMDKEFSEDEILHYNSEAIRLWILDPNKWARLEQMINHTMKLWNYYNPTKQIKYYQVDYNDKALRNILIHEAPRPTQLGYHTSTELFLELEKTWVAMKDKYPIWWWHAVTQWGYNTYDNYNLLKVHNSYSFDKFEELIKNWVIMRYGYLFLTV